MATVASSKDRSAYEGLKPYKLSVRQFEKMIAARVFPANARVELLGGLLATKNITPKTSWFEDVPIYRLSVRQFEKMIAAKIFRHDTRVELLGGIPAVQMTKYSHHNYAVRRLGNMLRELVVPDHLVSEEKSIHLAMGWRPEPDIVVARGPDDRYRKTDPTADDIALIAEVSESTYTTDRGVKWRGYAAAGIAVYWIVNLDQRVIEVYTNPVGREKQASYENKTVFAASDGLPVVIAGQEIGRIAVNEILP